MSRHILPVLIANDLDPFFAIEIIMLFAVLIANYSVISLLGFYPGSTQIDVEALSISLVKAAYIPFILILTMVIYAIASSMENGRFLTYISFPYSPGRVTSYMFAYSAIYPGTLATAVFTLDSWAFSFSTWLLVPTDLLYYTLCFSTMFVGIGLFLAVLTRNSILASGIPGSIYVFILPATIGNNVNSALAYAVAGLYTLKAGSLATTSYIIGGIFEVVMGLILFAASLVIVRKMNLKATRR